MKLFKNNKGSALIYVMTLGTVLLATGYYLYDQLVFSHEMTAHQIYKNQLDLHNISIADTVQTVLNTVVPNEKGLKVSLFSNGYTDIRREICVPAGCFYRNSNEFDHFQVADDNLFPPFIKSIYQRSKNVVDGDGKIIKLIFQFNYCNFINTKVYDSVFNKSSLLKEGFCDDTEGNLISDVEVSIIQQKLNIKVTSTLPRQAPYKGMSSSSSFSVKFPPKYTGCGEYIVLDQNTNTLTFKKDIGYITLPGVNIDKSVPYKFLLSRYNLTSEAIGPNEYKGSFTVYTHRNGDRFTSYMFKSAKKNPDGYYEIYWVIPVPSDKESTFWQNPMEYQNCNEVYPVLGGTEPAKNCGPYNQVISSSLNGGAGWTDTHKFDIVYNNEGASSKCTITRTTTSGLIPGVRSGGCFDENTVVEDSFGEQIKIKDLSMGKTLKNPVTNEIVRVIKTVAGPEDKDLIEIVTLNNSILVTQDHPVKTTRGLIRADQLTRDDLLFNEKGSIRISSIKKVPSNNRKVYNLMVSSDKNTHSDDDHYILANGIISGDLYLQNKLKYKNSLVIK